MRRAALLSIIVAIATVCGTACTAQPAERSSTPSASESTVIVERRSLTSTVVVAGVVAPTPEYLIEAPAAGLFTLGASTASGSALTEGQTIGRAGDQNVLAPVTGALTDVLVAQDTVVAPRVPVAAARYEGFGVQVNVPVSEQYRLYDGALSGKANVTGGPAGLACRLVAPRASGSEGEGTPALCLLPADAAVVTGLQAKVGLNTGTRTDVLALPLQAVSGRAERGEVTKISPDGTRQRLSVELGLSDGVYIEIRSGLDEGDTVASYPPGLG